MPRSRTRIWHSRTPCGLSWFLDGEYYGGFISAAKLLIDRFMAKKELPNVTSDQPYKVTLIGEKDGPGSMAIQQFCALIEDFGLEIYKAFPGYCSIEDMQKIGESDFTVILGGTQKAYAYLREIADYMNEKLGISHFASDYPIGWKVRGVGSTILAYFCKILRATLRIIRLR